MAEKRSAVDQPGLDGQIASRHTPKTHVQGRACFGLLVSNIGRLASERVDAEEKPQIRSECLPSSLFGYLAGTLHPKPRPQLPKGRAHTHRRTKSHP